MPSWKTSEVVSAVDLLVYMWMSNFILFLVMDDKGGVGKSIMAQVLISLLKAFDLKVAVIDTDFGNSTTAQIFTDTRMLDLQERARQGTLINVLKQVVQNTISHVVIDVGAREETPIKNMLPWLVEAVRKLGGRVVVFRPITLGSHNQQNAAIFMDTAMQLGSPTVFVRNEGQGRQPHYFDRWQATDLRAAALQKGAVETVLTDADVRYADEAVGLGLTLVECALQDFSKLEPTNDMDEAERKVAAADLEDAKRFFNDDVAAFLNEWLRENMRGFGDAIEEAIAIVDHVDAAMEPVDNEVPSTKRRPKKG